MTALRPATNRSTGDLRHTHTLAGVLYTGDVHIRAEQLNTAVRLAVSLHTFKHHLSIMQHRGSRIQLQRGIRLYTSGMPSLSLVISRLWILSYSVPLAVAMITGMSWNSSDTSIIFSKVTPSLLFCNFSCFSSKVQDFTKLYIYFTASINFTVSIQCKTKK